MWFLAVPENGSPVGGPARPGRSPRSRSLPTLDLRPVSHSAADCHTPSPRGPRSSERVTGGNRHVRKSGTGERRGTEHGDPAVHDHHEPLFATGLVFSGSPGEAAALLLVFVLLAGVNSPLVFPRSIGALEAQRRSAVDGRPVVYWRSGCKYCLRLRIRLGRSARQLHWVNNWRDPAGAAAVRATNDGNETAPTVVVAGQPHTNPDPAWVREQLSPST